MALFGILVIAALCGSFAAAQSGGKGSPTAGGKANVRPATPKPTPTPVPEAEAGPVDGEEIVVDTKLVTIPVRVMDRKGGFVPGLKKENFKVFEDGVEQEVALFSNDTQPFTVALVLDMSYSAKFKAAEIQNAAIEFIDQLRPEDRITVISFDEEVNILCEPTSDRKAIYAAIRRAQISTGTSLYEAVDLTINDRLRKIEGRKAMVLFTDGVDTTSRRSNDIDNLRDAMEIDTIIYPIRYDTFADVQRIKNNPMPQEIPQKSGTGGLPRGTTPPMIPTNNPSPFPFPIPTSGMGRPSDKGTTPEEYARGQEYLDQLSIRTGGRIYVADTLGNLSNAFSKIASELRELYSIGYYPPDESKGGKIRKIKVKVDVPNVAVKARDSYAVADTRK
ncbi:MAG: VWA domain-containing protein [bacterium]|nr:VWA domain-containing protein [bacterium]